MNYLRKLVSGKRRRFQDQQYDLDITYITERVVAMSYPATTMVESSYRNPIALVAKFLKERHGPKYKVFNCSERTYDKTQFDNQGVDYLWKDHHAPTLDLLFRMVQDMSNHLLKDPQNVIVVHCNSGKGRTGTAIACLLYYTGFVRSMDEALKYYGWKRFSSGVGVTQPCQLRMIYYFEAVMKGLVSAPAPKKLKAIAIQTVPSAASDGCRPFIEITNNVDDRVLYSTRDKDPLTDLPPKFYNLLSEKSMAIEFPEGKEPLLTGDAHLLLKHRGIITDSLICRVAINVAFVPKTLTLSRATISPDKSKKDSRFTNNFLLHFIFVDSCQDCTAKLSSGPYDSESRCQDCRDLLKEENEKWQIVHRVRESRPNLSAKESILLHFPSAAEEEESNKLTILGLKLKYDPEHYKIEKQRRFGESTESKVSEADQEESKCENSGSFQQDDQLDVEGEDIRKQVDDQIIEGEEGLVSEGNELFSEDENDQENP